MKQLTKVLKRVFFDNWKTSFCAFLILLAIGLKTAKLIDNSDMVAIMGVAGSMGLFAAKDGVRDEQVVAPENTDTPHAS